MKLLVDKYQVAIFFILSLAIPIGTYAISMAVGINGDSIAESIGTTIAKYGPSLAGLLTVALIGGMAGVATLIRRFLVWRVAVQWYMLVLLLPLILDDILPLILYKVFGGTAVVQPNFSLSTLPQFLPLFATYFFFGGGMGEEFGWRGYLTPYLQVRHSPIVAALIVGALWAAWHFPLYWMGDNSGAEIAYRHVEKLIRAGALAVVFAWVFNKTGGSVLLVAIMHAAINSYGRTYAVLPEESDQFFGSERIIDTLAIICWIAMAVVLILKRQLPADGKLSP